jgi:quercetin dioxygenase-like cupin family protein
MAGKEATIFLAEVAPGASTPKHYHPGQAFAYALAGTGVVYEQGKPPVTVKPGLTITTHSSPEKAAYVHWATTMSKTEVQKWLIVLITDQGHPLLIPVKEQKHK